MANPNDIARILNEMVGTLQDLSKRELDSVEKIISEQKKLLEQDRKIKESKNALSEIKKEIVREEEKLEFEQKKQIGLKKRLISSLVQTGKKISKNGVRIPGDKTPTISDLMGRVKIDFKNIAKNGIRIPGDKSSSISDILRNPFKKKQSDIDFERKSQEDDIQVEQLKVLKEIDKKLINFSFNGSGSWLSELFSGISKMVSGLLGNLPGIGALGSLGGLGGIFKGKFGKIGSVASRGLRMAKNPIALGAVGVGLAGTVAYNLMKEKKTEEIEPREKGGPIKFGKTYLVGEDGPEIFTPKQNGFIIPNNKLKTKKVSEDGSESVLIEFKKGILKNFSELVSKFDISFQNVGKGFKDRISDVYKDIKSWIGDYFDKAKNKAGDVYTGLKKNVSELIDGMKKMIVPQDVRKPVSPINNKIFKFDSKKDGLEKFNPMSVKLPEMNVEPEAIEISAPINLKPSFEINTGVGIDKKFWTDQFVPAFKNSLKVKTPETRTRFSKSSDPFG